MLQIKGLTITHKKDLRTIIEDFGLVLNAGDKAVMIGEEGNGKSTVMKWIFDSNMIEEYAQCKGEKIIGREKMGYLPQEMFSEDREKSIYEYFMESDFFFELTPRDLSELARKFGLETDIFYSNQIINTLSGGEKIKIQLIRILMEKPTILLLDEPSNDIDIKTLELLEHLINQWRGIVVYISHDETLIENTANVVIHLEQIQRKTKCRYTVSKIPYRQYLEERARIFKNQEQQAISDKKAKKIRDEKYAKVYQSVNSALNSCSRQAPTVAKNLKDKMHAVKAMQKRFEKEDERMTKMPESEDAIFFQLGKEALKIPSGKTVVDFSIEELLTSDGGKRLAKDIHLKIRGSQKVCIIGDNGVGKSTLLKLIATELLSRKDIHAEYMPQNYEELLDLKQTPVDFLDKTGEKNERTKIRTYLGSLKYTADEMEHPIGELSGGQKAKVLLLKMSLSDANVLILDEPTRNFSPLSCPVIREMIKNFPGAVISISHDRKYIHEVNDVIYELTPDGLITEEVSMSNVKL